MARFGQGMNPQLFAADYSPIMQGASIAAQGIAQGGSSIGQGIANLGAQIGAGVQKYYAKQEEKKLNEQAMPLVQNFLKSNPEVAAKVGVKDPNDPGLTKTLIKTLGGPAQAIGLVNQLSQAQEESRIRAVQLAEYQAQAQGRAALQRAFSPGMPLADASMQGRAQYAIAGGADPQMIGQAINVLTPPENKQRGSVMTAQQIESFAARGLDVKAQPLPDGTFLATEVSPFGKPPTTNVNLGEKALDSTVGRLTGERLDKEFNMARDAVQNIAKLDETLNLIETGDPTVGVFSELQNNVNRLRSKFLDDKKAGRQVTDTQILDALLGSDVFPQIGALGIGARGLDTPAEREFLRSVMTGTTAMNKESLIKLTEIRRKLQERAIGKYNESVDRGDFGRYFEAAGMKPVKFDIPARVAPKSGPRIISVEPIK